MASSTIIISSRNYNQPHVNLNGQKIRTPRDRAFTATPELLALLDNANPPVPYAILDTFRHSLDIEGGLRSGAVLTSPAGLRRFRAALAKAPFEPVSIGCWGDSITQGVGTEISNGINTNTVADTLSYAGQLRAAFATEFGTVGGSVITPYYEGVDARVTRSGSPAADSTAGPMKQGGRIRSTDYFEFTTPACTGIDVLYYAAGAADGTINGGFSYQIDGGAVTTGLATGTQTDIGYKSLRITGLSNQVHTIRLVGLHATNQQHITGIRYHNNNGLIVGRYARGGWTLLDALGIGDTLRNSAAGNSANSQSRMLANIGAWDHLTILSFGQNDGTLQNIAQNPGGNVLYTTPDEYETRTRAIISTVAAYGGCTLLLNTGLPPASGVTVPAGYSGYYEYHERWRKIAAEMDHVAHLSIADRWGRSPDGAASSQEASDTGMLFGGNTVHPGKVGYFDMNRAISATLRRHDLIAA